mgnify:CR=1 FL=1
MFDLIIRDANLPDGRDHCSIRCAVDQLRLAWL